MRDSPVSCTIDLDQDGVQHGFLKLPHSHDVSAWGAIMVPVTSVRNGNGPVALLTGANHGDEYEGPTALMDLSAHLQPVQVQGQAIIVPGMNYPAFRAGRRTSPIDGGNMNRVFPGRPDGGVTEKIADYFQRHLLPRADFVLDFHSGGRTLDFVPFAAAHVLPDPDQQAQCVAAMRAFNAPYSVMLLEIDSVGMYDTSAEEMGKVFVSTELGGGGSSTAKTVQIAKRGLANFLKHAGILAGEPEIGPTRHLDMPDGKCFVTSESNGLVEFCVDLGEEVRAGDLLAKVYDVERSGGKPRSYKAPIDGFLAGRHYPGLIAMGDFMAMIAIPVDG
ncbi:MAG: N(2)-acetyl-L-2,4-diaminobutanoate deacetylase DoeB [Pseudomonadota bacterium]